MSLTEDIKDFAREIGFQAVGVTAAAPLPDAEAIMLDRINRGFIGEMAWFNAERAEKACNPNRLLPSAASVITLIVPYPIDCVCDDLNGTYPNGRISRYAWSEDYHDTIRERLQEIERYLARRNDANGNVATKVYVDSGPIAERAFAERSGLGWFGKSTNVLTEKFGSWVFLSEIVTNLVLEADSPLKKSCGSCDFCVRACPTGAIVSPYTVDARRCISFLTIENKGAVPRELRPLIGNWVFGCDVCQEVCPVNKKARTPGQGFIRPLEGVSPRPNLLDIVEMTDIEFRTKFRVSPIKRAKKRGLQRNAAVALGNCGDSGIVPHLIPLLDNPEELVRGHLVWALGNLGGSVARRALEIHRRRESSDFVLRELEKALGMLSPC